VKPTLRETLGVAAATLAAAALALGTSLPADAAASPSPGWHTFNAATGDGSLSGIYAVSASDAWAASEGPSGGKVFHFTGTAWESVNSPDLGALEAISGTSDSDIWVLGATTAAHWNGSSWTSSSLALPAGATEGDETNLLYDAGANDVYAAVSYAVTDKGTLVEEEGLEHFNGKAWTAVTGLPNFSVTSSIVTGLTGGGADDVYLTSTYAFTTKSEVLQFNGHTWSAVQLPGSPYAPQIDVTGAGQALALGASTSDTTGYAAQLSGGKWTTVSLPLSNNVPSASAGGSGTAWAALIDYPAESVWKFSAGKWTQTQATSAQASGLLFGAADGSAVWALSGADTYLYVG
jgi:hypothetical protein